MAQALLIAGTAYGAYAQNEAGKAQQDLANRNAKMIEAQAEDALDRGNEEAMAIRRRTRRVVGAQRAAFAGQGVDVDTGVASELQDESRALGNLDEAQVRRNSWREAWGLHGQASNQRLSGTYARRAGQNQAAGTVLGGIANSYPYWSSGAPTAMPNAPAPVNATPSRASIITRPVR